MNDPLSQLQSQLNSILPKIFNFSLHTSLVNGTLIVDKKCYVKIDEVYNYSNSHAERVNPVLHKNFMIFRYHQNSNNIKDVRYVNFTNIPKAISILLHLILDSKMDENETEEG